jgi:hypothetical protein
MFEFLVIFILIMGFGEISSKLNKQEKKKEEEQN